MTDKEKQIEELARVICDGCTECKRLMCYEWYVAQKIYNAGYRKQSGWISVDERLPEMYEDVLCFDGLSVEIDFMCSDNTWCGVHNNPITHWMPLPEPPKMKGGESDG